MSLYQYTLLKQDGTKYVFEPCKKKSLSELYKILECTTVTTIPFAYWAGRGYGRVTMWADDEARFKNTARRNPFFHVLDGGADGEFDVVDNVLMDQKL